MDPETHTPTLSVVSDETERKPECFGTIGSSTLTPCSTCDCNDACSEAAAALVQEPETEPQEKPEPDFGVIDKSTGEMSQLTLLGAEWEQYKIKTLRLSLSGGDEFIKEIFDQLVDGELTPGAIVEVNARGIVKEHAPIFSKGTHEGKTVILLEVVRTIKVMGHMTGKVEAAQNVDGEPKALEEAAGSDPEPSHEEQKAEPVNDSPCEGCAHIERGDDEDPCHTCSRVNVRSTQDYWESLRPIPQEMQEEVYLQRARWPLVSLGRTDRIES